ncbi:MAG TPA: xanthine dehydrogenase family protein molybdopterin-binding subunit [Stellaceae bacterium]|nr:xanthine dehydrogenase family protein molybdopterin-binding subunit [Stellaceae bacterium]
MTQHPSIPFSAVLSNVSRRHFLKGTIAAGSVVIAAQFLPLDQALAYTSGVEKFHGGAVNDPHVFIAIDRSGLVTIIAHRSEMGTGSRTSLPMIVADEMDADWQRVKVVQAPGDEMKYGNQDTDGSRSVRHFFQAMRQCGAAARQMLEEAAARNWGVGLDEVEARDHEIIHKPSGRKVGFGDVAEAAAELPTPPMDQLRLKDPASFRYIGKGAVKIVDLFDITTGKAVYGNDVMLPGMKFAVIARPPVLGGKVASVESSAALAVPGVERVVMIEGTPPPAKFQPLGGVAVIASNTWAAMKGREALKITWEDGPNKSYDSDAFRAELEATASKPGKIVRLEGDPEKALSLAAKTVSAQYYLPHLAHATMEPPSATVRIADGKCEAWTSVQSPDNTRDELAKKLGLDPANVRVNVTLLGGGFGRKSKCDYVLEAGLLSREMGGAPVKVIWTREDDLQNDYYHTVAVERLDAGLDANGKVIAWRHRSVAPSIVSIFAPDQTHEAPFELGMGLIDVPYAIPNLACENGEAMAHTRIGWFRSVYNIPHAFAVQSFTAELAHAAGRDPKEFLLELIGPPRLIDPGKDKDVTDFWNYGAPLETYPIDTARLARVVNLAADKGAWGRTLPAGHGMGIAVHRSFLTYVATCLEVRVDTDGRIHVPRVDTAIDCGFVVNPERIRSQIEGAAVMGMSLALYGEVTFKEGRVQQRNFDDFQVIRIDESPHETHVHIVPATIDVPPAGVGEPGLPPFTPALCNAIFAATGKRIRRLPIGDQLKA